MLWLMANQTGTQHLSACSIAFITGLLSIRLTRLPSRFLCSLCYGAYSRASATEAPENEDKAQAGVPRLPAVQAATTGTAADRDAAGAEVETELTSRPDDFPTGFQIFPDYFSRDQQDNLLDIIRDCLTAAPLFQPVMPRTGKPFSVRMSNCGVLGWVSDINGYRYQPTHPVTSTSWPPIPEILTSLWSNLAPDAPPPEACLINFYEDTARMGLHQDKDEAFFEAPVISVSLGDTAVFRIGGTDRKEPTRSLKLHSGDVVVLGGKCRLAYHGIDRVIPNTSTLMRNGGRVNLTLRRVTQP